MSNRKIVTACAILFLTAGCAIAAGLPADVPFELFHNVILVPVHLGDRGPYLAMIDTGTDPSAIDIALAKELGLRLGRGGEIDGGGTQTVKAFETRLASVRVGSVTAVNVEVLAGGSIAKIGATLGRPIRLVLGKSFLNGRVVQFDFPRKMMRFLARSPDAVAAPGRRAILPSRYEDDVELDGVRVDGKPVRAILDTGSNGSLKITPEAVHALGLGAAASGGKKARGTGYRGTYSSREGHVESLDLGGIRVADPEAIFWLPNTGHDGKPWDVNVGNSILKDFVVTLDTVGRHVLIEKP